LNQALSFNNFNTMGNDLKNKLMRKKRENSYAREAVRIKTGISTNRNAFGRDVLPDKHQETI
jgi:hypothetical protein